MLVKSCPLSQAGEKVKLGSDYPRAEQSVHDVLKDLSQDGLLLDFKGNGIFLCVKGALESLEQFLEPVVAARARVASQVYQQQGHRVLALAYRNVLADNMEELDACTENDLLQPGLSFVGLVVLESKLAEHVGDTICTLRNCGVKLAVLSGDNSIACAHVAYNSQMVDEDHAFLLLDVRPGGVFEARLVSNGVDNGFKSVKLDLDFTPLMCFLVEALPLFGESAQFRLLLTDSKKDLFSLKLGENYRHMP